MMKGKKLSLSELSFFCMDISIILKSGMLLENGVSMMYDDLKEGNLKEAAKILKEKLSDNMPLYKAMELSGYFPTHVVNMAQIGSITGNLEEVMASLSNFYDRDEYIRIKIRNSILYPAILFIMMSCVIVILVTKIFPIFQDMINQLGGEMSDGAAALMSFSAGIAAGKFMMYLVLAVIAAAFALTISWRTKKGRAFFDSLLSRFIFTRDIKKKVTAFRFTSSLSLLLSSGMNIDDSIDLLFQIVDDAQLKAKIRSCQSMMRKGDLFIDSISKLGLFPSMHVQMLSMGQNTGELDSVMKKLTDIYENEAESSISEAVSLIEPVLVGILSGAIGVILISVMIPLMNIMSSIG
jgi:type IV pilus assembly protein PilC